MLQLSSLRVSPSAHAPVLRSLARFLVRTSLRFLTHPATSHSAEAGPSGSDDDGDASGSEGRWAAASDRILSFSGRRRRQMAPRQRHSHYTKEDLGYTYDYKRDYSRWRTYAGDDDEEDEDYVMPRTRAVRGGGPCQRLRFGFSSCPVSASAVLVA